MIRPAGYLIFLGGLLAGHAYALEWSFLNKTPPDLCQSPESFIYKDYLRDIETSFTMKDFFTGIAKVTKSQHPEVPQTFVCKKIANGQYDDYSLSFNSKALTFRFRTNKRKTSDKQ